MKKYFLFFAICFVAVTSATFLAALFVGRNTEAGDVDHEAWQQLHREAALIEHFCLGSALGVYGRATIPAEWERALKSTVRLREGVGEIASEGPELKKRADDIRNLTPGQSLELTAGQGDNRRHMLVYRPKQPVGQILLFVAKNETDLVRNADDDPVRPLGIALLIGLAAAILLAAAARFIWPPQ